jgi:predicted TIM-barrel fold metal-dependent hydrolase
MLIDCHAHAFADKIADKAVQQLIDYYKIETTNGGHLTDLINTANQAKLDAFILLVAATKPEQVKPANDWVLEIAAKSQAELEQCTGLSRIPQIIPFGAYHPADPNWLTEVNRLKTAGIKGIKLHPEFQRIDLADSDLNPFFEEISDHFVLMIHIGDPKVSLTNLSTPQKVAAIIKKFPKLKVIAAHLGGYCFWNEVLEELAGKELYLDTSSALQYIEPEMLKKIISKHGSSKILFGSDYPLNTPQKELELIDGIPWLSATAKERIYGQNCAELLNLA